MGSVGAKPGPSTPWAQAGSGVGLSVLVGPATVGCAATGVSVRDGVARLDVSAVGVLLGAGPLVTVPLGTGLWPAGFWVLGLCGAGCGNPAGGGCTAGPPGRGEAAVGGGAFSESPGCWTIGEGAGPVWGCWPVVGWPGPG